MKIAQHVNAMRTEAAAAAADLHMMTCCVEPRPLVNNCSNFIVVL